MFVFRRAPAMLSFLSLFRFFQKFYFLLYYTVYIYSLFIFINKYVRTSAKRVDLIRKVLGLTDEIEITSMVIRLAEDPNYVIEEQSRHGQK